MKGIWVVFALAAIGLTLVLGLPAMAAPRALMTDSLIGWWSMDEASGTRADSVGTNNLTDNNTVGYSSTAKINNAALFIEVNNEFLSVADNANLSTGDIDFSYVAWVKLSSISSYQRFGSKGIASTASDYEWLLDYAGGAIDRFRFLISDGAGHQTVLMADNFGAAITNTWYFLAVVHNANTNVISISINAGTPNTQTWSYGSNDSGYSFVIGGTSAPVGTFTGLVDEAAFWKRALTSAEISTLYNSGAGCSYANLSNNCQTSTNTPTATNTPTNTPTATPDFASWPYPTAKSSSGFAENGGATLGELYQANGVVITYTENNGAGGQWVQLNYAGIPAATLTALHWRVWGYYSGGHAVKAQCYSPTFGWSSLTGSATDLPTASVVTFYEFAVSLADCVTSGNLQLRFYHSTNGNGTHLLVLDQAILHGATIATATPTPAPGTATPTGSPTNTPTPTVTPTPLAVDAITLDSGNRFEVDRRATVGEIGLICVGSAGLFLGVLYLLTTFLRAYLGGIWFQ